MKRAIEPEIDVSLELKAVQNPAPELSVLAGMTGSAPGTATSATVVSVAELSVVERGA